MITRLVSTIENGRAGSSRLYFATYETCGLEAAVYLLGHLLITAPIIAAIPAMIRFGLYMFGPDFYPYYVTAAMAIGWQWYSVAVPHWEKRSAHLAFEDADSNETARRVGLVWPGASTVGRAVFKNQFQGDVFKKKILGSAKHGRKAFLLVFVHRSHFSGGKQSNPGNGQSAHRESLLKYLYITHYWGQ